MILLSPTRVNSGCASTRGSPRFMIWIFKTSRASSGPRQEGVRFHQRWPCEMPRHSASSAKRDANGSGSPLLRASAAARSWSIILRVCHPYQARDWAGMARPNRIWHPAEGLFRSRHPALPILRDSLGRRQPSCPVSQACEGGPNIAVARVRALACGPGRKRWGWLACFGCSAAYLRCLASSSIGGGLTSIGR